MTKDRDLDRERTVAFVREHYHARVGPTGQSLLSRLYNTADRAFVLADQYQIEICKAGQPIDPPAPDACWHAGMLCTVMQDFAVPFEDVMDVTNIRVAEMAGSLSHDVRLSLPRRVLQYTSQLGQADFFTQLVKLADMLEELEEWKAFLYADPVEARKHIRVVVLDLSQYHDAIWKMGKHYAMSRHYFGLSAGLSALLTTANRLHRERKLQAQPTLTG